MRRWRSDEDVSSAARWCLVAALALSACSDDVVNALVLPPCQSDSSSAECSLDVWPNEVSSANSQPWLIAHHDQLVRIEPRVLVLDFYNGLPVAQVAQIAAQQSQALALGSSYHAYSNAGAPAFVNYKILKTVDLTNLNDLGGVPANWAYPSSTKLPVTPSGAFDPTALFTQTFAESYAIADQSGRNLTLCELFEQGFVNEVWVSIGEGPPRGIDSLERKQIYDANLKPIGGQFEPAAGGSGDLTGFECSVTVRIAHLSPVLGLGCDLDIRSWSLEAETTLGTIPYLHDNALAFFNSDFKSRFGVAFDSWDDLCGDDSDTMPCVTYDSPTSASGTDTNGTAWTIGSFIQGCGTATFPPNARYRNDFVDDTPVASRCGHYRMGDGPGGADLTDMYTTDLVQQNVTALTALSNAITPPLSLPGSDCGGGWQVYLRQSVPGYQNAAKDTKGQQMKNWWPFLFY